MLKRFSQSALNPVSSLNITAECKCLLNHRYLKSVPARGGLKVLKGMQQNQTIIYLGVGEPITTHVFTLWHKI